MSAEVRNMMLTVAVLLAGVHPLSDLRLVAALRRSGPEAQLVFPASSPTELLADALAFLGHRSLPAPPAPAPDTSCVDVLLVSGKIEPWYEEVRSALACGVPVVASEAPAAIELVGAGGVLIPAGRFPGAAAAAVGQLASSPCEREALGRRARAQARRLERRLGPLHPPAKPGDADPGASAHGNERRLAYPSVRALKTIRVVRDGGIGDLVMLIPALRELAGRGYRVHLACDARWIELFRCHPALAAVEDMAGDLPPLGRTVNLVRAVDFAADHPRARSSDRVDLFCEVLGVEPVDRRPDLHLPAEAHDWAESFCGDLGSFAVVQYRATSPYRTYPHMAEVCRGLLVHLPVIAVSDLPWEERPSAARDLCGTAPAAQVAAVIGRAAVLVGPDSGGLHLAGAQGVPFVGLYGPYPPDLRLAHYAWKRALRAAPECPPCFEDPVHCGQIPPPCLRGIDPQEVVRQALSLIELRETTR